MLIRFTGESDWNHLKAIFNVSRTIRTLWYQMTCGKVECDCFIFICCCACLLRYFLAENKRQMIWSMKRRIEYTLHRALAKATETESNWQHGRMRDKSRKNDGTSWDYKSGPIMLAGQEVSGRKKGGGGYKTRPMLNSRCKRESENHPKE